MPIFQKNDALTNAQKNAIKDSHQDLLSRFGGEFPLHTYKILIKELDTISKSNENNVLELFIYLKAVNHYLDLKINRRFFLGGERKLIAALRYFIESQDVIPDWETDGYIDDIYCLNLALKAQSPSNLNKIELSANSIKRNIGFNSGTE